jgi:transcriptional regulator GlxA family with amidase domain
MPEFIIPHVTTLPVGLPRQERRRRVVIVVIPGATPLEFIGPMEYLGEANFMLDHSDRSDLGYDIEMVTTRPGIVYERKGLKIVVDRSYRQLRGKIDTLIFQPIDYDERCLQDKHFISWVGRIATRVRRVATVCIGTYILAEAGVLDGRRATTHWSAVEDFARRYPRVNLEADPIYVKDGNVYTSAGASSGLDLTLALIEEDFGSELALRVAQGMVMYLKRPGNQAQFSVHMSQRSPEDQKLQQLQSYIAENLHRDLNVESLADRVGMSARNFARVFGREVGMTPGRFIERSRLERARQLLEQSDLSISQISTRCGYGTTEGMRLAFDRNLSVVPRDYRRRFSSSKAG